MTVKDDEDEVEMTATAEKDASESHIAAGNETNNNNNDDKEFPDPFYCPITDKVMHDPVVLSDGLSYEKSAVSSRDEKMYSNRALKAVIDDTLAVSGKSIRANMVRMERSLRKALSEVWEKSLLPSTEHRPLPDVYYCPITFSLIHEPVIDPEGNTYEKNVILKWIAENGDSPLTRTALSADDLFPNHAIRDLLDIEKNRDEASIHPSIRKFKEEKPPSTRDDLETGDGGGGETPHFPMNHEELDESERRRRQLQIQKFTCIAFFFTAVFILLVIVGFPALVILPLLIFLSFSCCTSQNNRGNNSL